MGGNFDVVQSAAKELCSSAAFRQEYSRPPFLTMAFLIAVTVLQQSCLEKRELANKQHSYFMRDRGDGVLVRAI
jgi:hypothetical protein